MRCSCFAAQEIAERLLTNALVTLSSRKVTGSRTMMIERRCVRMPQTATPAVGVRCVVALRGVRKKMGAVYALAISHGPRPRQRPEENCWPWRGGNNINKNVGQNKYCPEPPCCRYTCINAYILSLTAHSSATQLANQGAGFEVILTLF